MPKFTFQDVQYVSIRDITSPTVNVIPLESNKRIPMKTATLKRISSVKHVIKTGEDQYDVKCDLYEESIKLLVDWFILIPKEKKLKHFKSFMECDFISKKGKKIMWTAWLTNAFNRDDTLIFSTLLNYRITKKFPTCEYRKVGIPMYIEEMLEDIDPHSLSYYGSNVVNAYIAYKCCYLADRDLEGTKEIRKELIESCLDADGGILAFIFGLCFIGKCPYIAYLLLKSAREQEKYDLEEKLIEIYSKQNINYEEY